MARCAECGSFYLFGSNRGGLCKSCYQLKLERIEREKNEKAVLALEMEQQERKAAEAFFDELVGDWQLAKESPLAAASVDHVSQLAAACALFCDMAARTENIPRFSEALSDHITYTGFSYCDIEGLGLVDMERTGGGNAIVKLSKLEEAAKENKALCEEIIAASTEFKKQCASIRHVDVVPDLSAEEHPPEDRTSLLETRNITAKTPVKNINSFIVVDLETTGLNQLADEIIQISAVKFSNFVPVECFTTFVKPRRGLNAHAQSVNGITEADVADAPYIEQVLPALEKYLGSRNDKNALPIVGHNLSFDCKFLEANGCLALVLRKCYDTLELSKRQYKGLSKYTLDYLTRNILRIVRSDAHSALSDAVAAGLLFAKIAKERIGISEGE